MARAVDKADAMLTLSRDLSGAIYHFYHFYHFYISTLVHTCIIRALPAVIAFYKSTFALRLLTLHAIRPILFESLS